MTQEEIQKLIKDQIKSKQDQFDALTANANDALDNAANELGKLATPDFGSGPQGLFEQPSKGAKVSVTLPKDLANFVTDLVNDGQYIDSGEAIRDALRRMQCDPCFRSSGSSKAKCEPGIGGLSGLAAAGQLVNKSALAYDGGGESPAIWHRILATSGDVSTDVAGLIALQRLMGQVERDIAANERNTNGPLDLSFGIGSERQYSFLLAPTLARESSQGWRLAPLRATERGVTTVAHLKAVLDELGKRLNEIAELQQLRLQMIMDRRAKMASAISNLLKKIAETQQQIAANLK